VIVANFSRRDAAYDAGKLPGGGRAVKEFWSERDLSGADMRSLVVPAKKFLLFGVNF
jgi:hypothetical protein